MTQDTDKPATSIKDAADRLQRALAGLQTSLEPMVTRLGDLENKHKISIEGEKDRARLANELDKLTAEHKTLKSREAEFSKLADETTKELDAVIKQVLNVLGES